MEDAIGKIITFPNGKKAKVVERECFGCMFWQVPFGCLKGARDARCHADVRTDHKNIIFKEIKE